MAKVLETTNDEVVREFIKTHGLKHIGCFYSRSHFMNRTDIYSFRTSEWNDKTEIYHEGPAWENYMHLVD
jgi:hypothetical protein